MTVRTMVNAASPATASCMVESSSSATSRVAQLVTYSACERPTIVNKPVAPFLGL